MTLLRSIHSPGLDFHTRGKLRERIYPSSPAPAAHSYLPLQGLATVLAGAASFWIIQDFPDEAKFLTEEERTCGAFAVQHMIRGR
jgi:hypothetical protein